MASVCVSSCVKDAGAGRAPVVRATYVNLYKWPESDADFIRSNGHRPTVMDSISCRQLYLRSYTFSREDDGGGRARKERGVEATKRRKRKSRGGGESSGGGGGNGRRKKKMFRIKRAMVSIFRGLLSCTAKVDVVG